jgi:hypothetical protein
MPKITTTPTVPVSTRLPVEVAERLTTCAHEANMTVSAFAAKALTDYLTTFAVAPKVIPVRPPVTGPRRNMTDHKCNITDEEFDLLGVSREDYDSHIQYDVDELLEFVGHLYWIRGHAPASEDFLPYVRYDGDIQYLDWAEYHYTEVEPRPSVIPMFKRIRAHLGTLKA